MKIKKREVRIVARMSSSLDQDMVHPATERQTDREGPRYNTAWLKKSGEKPILGNLFTLMWSDIIISCNLLQSTHIINVVHMQQLSYLQLEKHILVFIKVNTTLGNRFKLGHFTRSLSFC